MQWRPDMRLTLLVPLILLDAGVLAAQSRETATDTVRLKVSDTVRVWSSQLKLKGKRGIVSRVRPDSLAFVAPSGFRQLPKEFAADLPSLDRVDVLAGRTHSMSRF